LEGIVVHLESVLSHTPRSWQGSHTSRLALRARRKGLPANHRLRLRAWGPSASARRGA